MQTTTKLLYHIYPNIVTLNQYLNERLKYISQLIRPNDSSAYEQLLSTSLVVQTAINGVPVDRERVLERTKLGFIPENNTEQSYIVNHVIDSLFKYARKAGKKKPAHVLTAGYRSLYDNRYDDQVYDPTMGPQTAECHHPNTLVNVITSTDWQILLSRIGDAAMIHLLTDTSIFVSLPNSCYLQISGIPITEISFPTKIPYINSTTMASRTFLGILSNKNNVDCNFTKPEKRSRDDIEADIPKTDASFEKVSYNESHRATKLRKIDHKLQENHTNNTDAKPFNISPSTIFFARFRIFHSRPLYSGPAKRKNSFGFSHTHILNRFKNTSTTADAEHILKYIFPGQFNFKNAFTTNTSRLPIKEYLFREEEIQEVKIRKIPWRLRNVIKLVEEMMRSHQKTKYQDLIKFYCPVPFIDDIISSGRQSSAINKVSSHSAVANLSLKISRATQDILSGLLAIAAQNSIEFIEYHDRASAQKGLLGMSSDYDKVSKFINATLVNVIPMAFWGSKSNFQIIKQAVHKFVRLKQYQSLSLHSVLQGFKLNDCVWLDPPLNRSRKSKKGHMPPSEIEKRRQILAEFIYWIFDSFVIPLIQMNFYVTEATPHQYRIFYYRHDMWAYVMTPSVKRLEGTILKKIKTPVKKNLEKFFSRRRLAYSHLRFLPKENGLRLILNLSQKIPIDIAKHLKKISSKSPYLGISTNSILQNAFHVLKFEKSRQTKELMLGWNEIYPRFKKYKALLKDLGVLGRKEQIYFAAVDVRCSFDSIDQEKLIKILTDVLQSEEYTLQRYAQVIPAAGRIKKSFMKKAWLRDDHPRPQFLEFAHELAKSHRQAVFIDQVVYPFTTRKEILAVLREHILQNIVKAGKNFYIQKKGIPQGSVLSSLLCSYFYDDMEKKELHFVALDKGGLLLRYVDDFLYISLSRESITKFLKSMYEGYPEYGCFINKDKTLVNFDVNIDGMIIHKSYNSLDFPWCGLLIHTNTLEVKSDFSRYYGNYMNEGMTIDSRQPPGEFILQKMIHAIKNKIIAIHLDTSINSNFTVLLNLYQNFLFCAMKFHNFVKELLIDGVSESFLIHAVNETVHFGFVWAWSLSEKTHTKCHFTKNDVIWLGKYAFYTILTKKHAIYPKLLQSLKTFLERGSNRKLMAVVDWNLSKVFYSILY